MADVRQTVCFRRQVFLNMRNICWLIIKKNGTFLNPETISTNWLAVYLKEKGKCLPHILKQKYRHIFFFLTNSRPWHALHCLLCICNSDLPTTRFSTKEVFFCVLFLIPDSNRSFVLSNFPQLCTYLHQFKSVWHKARLHLNTSWKTRHLVFSHITSEKSWPSPYVRSRNVARFTKNVIIKTRL